MLLEVAIIGWLGGNVFFEGFFCFVLVGGGIMVNSGVSFCQS